MGQRAELLIYDPIGRDFRGDGVSPAEVVNALSALDEGVTDLDVRINSPGGFVDDGVAIYNALARSPHRITVHVDGLAASIASVIAMAGDEIVMSTGSRLMLHNASAITIGDAARHEDRARQLQQVNDLVAGIYASRTGEDRADVLEMMAAETWLTPDEAVDRGFATRVGEAKKSRPTARWGEAGALLLASYSHTPDEYQPHPRHVDQRIAARAAEDRDMDKEQIARLRAALGLPEDAQPETILAAVEAREDPPLTASSVDLTQYVPREELDAVRDRLATVEAREQVREIDEALSAAHREGKIVSQPAVTEYRKQLVAGTLTLEAFRSLMAATPASKLAARHESGGGGDVPKQVDVTDEAAIRSACQALGLDEHSTDFCVRNQRDPEQFKLRLDRRRNPDSRRSIAI